MKFIAAVLVIVILTIAVKESLKNKYRFEKVARVSAITTFLCVMFLAIPASFNDNAELPLIRNIFLSIAQAFLYAFKSMAGGSKIEDLLSFYSSRSLIDLFCFYVSCIMFIAAPLTTSSLIVTSFSGLRDQFKYALHKNANKHVFTEINSNAVILAKSIHETEKDALIIFCNISDTKNINPTWYEEMRSIGALFLRRNELNIDPGTRMHVYAIGDNPDKNAIIARKFAGTYKIVPKHYLEKDSNGTTQDTTIEDINLQKDITVIVYGQSRSADILLSDSEIENDTYVKIRPFYENRMVAYDLLYHHPLYDRIQNNELNILIIGLGSLGREIFQACLFCGLIPGVKLRITCIDQDIDNIKNEFESLHPELTDGFNHILPEDDFSEPGIQYIACDAASSQFDSLLQKINKGRIHYNYCVAATKSDDLNLNISMKIDRYMNSSNVQSMAIYYRVRNDDKFEAYSKMNLFFSNRIAEQLPFGSQKSFYSYAKTLKYDLIEMGRLVNAAYRTDIFYSNITKQKFYSLDEEIKLTKNHRLDQSYYNSYNFKSSIAVALSINYKLYIIYRYFIKQHILENVSWNTFIKLGMDEMIMIDDALKYDTVLCEMLRKNEHDRWVFYMRSEGYCHADVKMVQDNIDSMISSYIENLKKNGSAPETYTSLKIDVDSKLRKYHPALVPDEQLNKVTDELIKLIDVLLSDDENAKYPAVTAALMKLKIKVNGYKTADMSIIKNITNIVEGRKMLNESMKLTDREINLLAKQIFDDYNTEKLKKNPNDKIDYPDWETAPETIRQSNVDQANDLCRKVIFLGYSLTRDDSQDIVHQFSPEEVEILTRREHDRFVKDRIKDGWKSGEKDVKKKTSPYLIEYDKLSEEVKQLDRDAVLNVIPLLDKIGIKVCRNRKER